MAKQYVSRNGKPLLADRKEFERWNDMPYGLWTCGDGREVLFNRFYEPIYQRRPGEPVTDADAAEWVNWDHAGWIYDDGHKEPEKRKRAVAALKAFQALRPVDLFDCITAKKAG